MRRLDRIREALGQLSPQHEESTSPIFHPRISLRTLKELIECLFYVFFPESTNPPSHVAPAVVDSISLMEWVIGHVIDILITQIYFAFVLHGDTQIVEKLDDFRPLNTPQRTNILWNESHSTTLSMSRGTGAENCGAVAAAAPGALMEGSVMPTVAPEVMDKANCFSLPDVPGSSGAAVATSTPTVGAADANKSAHLVFLANCRRKAEAIVTKFVVERLSHVRWLLRTDVEAILKKDVAASSVSEVVLCYPGIRCMVHQRVAHQLHLLGVPQNFTRMLTEIAHSETGIDIHPHTSIGHHFFIDHGTGIVIGATARIGNDVSIYQGVTLGARSFPTDEKTGERIRNLPRHPIIEDGVTLYANAVVLGRVTIGERSTIGGNCWVVRDVPPFSSIVQKPNDVLLPHERMFLERDGSGI